MHYNAVDRCAFNFAKVQREWHTCGLMKINDELTEFGLKISTRHVFYGPTNHVVVCLSSYQRCQLKESVALILHENRIKKKMHTRKSKTSHVQNNQCTVNRITNAHSQDSPRSSNQMSYYIHIAASIGLEKKKNNLTDIFHFMQLIK